MIDEPTRQHPAAGDEASVAARTTPDAGWFMPMVRWLLRSLGRTLVFVVGVAMIAVGIAMLVLPGPGLLVVIAGLVVLATQFAWAERALHRVKERTASTAGLANSGLRSLRSATARRRHRPVDPDITGRPTTERNPS